MGSKTDSPAEPDRHELLARWTAAGLIDAAQANRIEAVEEGRERLPAASPTAPRLPLVVEALGYLGAVVAMAGGFVAVHQFWPHVPTGAELAFFGLAAGVLTVTGAMLSTKCQPALGRLRSVLWLLATASAVALASVLAHRVLRMSGNSASSVTAATWAACAIPLWWRARSALTQLSMFGGAVAVVETTINQMVSSVTGWELGLGLWALSALWGAAAWRGYLAPRTAALAASGSGALIGAIVTMHSAAGTALALVTVAGLLAVGVVFRQVLMLGLGAAGVLWVVPVTANRYLPGSVAAPLTVAVVGILLLTVALWLARTRARTRVPPRQH